MVYTVYIFVHEAYTMEAFAVTLFSSYLLSLFPLT